MMAYSQVNGPGKRAVIWLQGCTLACPGCFNPETHGAGGGKEYPVEQLMDWLATLAGSIDGLSISGGEPLQQLPHLVNFLQQVRQKLGLPVLLFTGYTWLEVQKMPAAPSLIDCVDVVIAGRYLAEQRQANHLIGSSNKTVHFITHTYTLDDLNSIPPAEVVIDPSGAVVLSGIDPLIW
jgi:anaerobic ribonucleoside-triphosphate reductase activating protein